MKISEQLREVICRCGISRYRIAKETGLSQSLLSRFIAGKCSLSLAAMDRLGELLGLEIHAVRQGQVGNG